MWRLLALIAVVGFLLKEAEPVICLAAPWDGDGSQNTPAQSQPATTRPDEKQAGDVDVKAVDLRAGDDQMKRYFLIGPPDLSKAPKDGFKLVLVLPGGDGSADFAPFVQNAYKRAMPEGYVVVQLVAPVWSKEQADKIVWPTKTNPVKDARFTTEEFIDSVIDDAAKRSAVDRHSIFTLSWSSSGPAAYAASLTEGTRIAGSFVAMSVFNPQFLPDLKGAKGKAYYILHSPQDFIKMRFPEAARDELARNGAVTKLETYEGGHGWKGDVFGNIKAGIQWLEQQCSRK